MNVRHSTCAVAAAFALVTSIASLRWAETKGAGILESAAHFSKSFPLWSLHEEVGLGIVSVGVRVHDGRKEGTLKGTITSRAPGGSEHRRQTMQSII